MFHVPAHKQQDQSKAPAQVPVVPKQPENNVDAIVQVLCYFGHSARHSSFYPDSAFVMLFGNPYYISTMENALAFIDFYPRPTR